jgi:cytochrome c peroxidase
MRKPFFLMLAGMLLGGVAAWSAPLDDYLSRLAAQAKQNDPAFSGFDAKRGEKIFFSEHIGKRGKKISCASCHTRDLKAVGENIFTGKKIDPLSPTANPERLSDIKKVKKWLRRNFRDVYKREGTPREKGDVLLYIMQH